MYPKVITICILGLFLGVTITPFSPSNNQSFATLIKNENLFNTIKKSCSNSQLGNNNNVNIQELVDEILKVCFPLGSHPPTSSIPSNLTPFGENVLTLNINANDQVTGTITLFDSQNNQKTIETAGGQTISFIMEEGKYSIAIQSPVKGTFTSSDCTVEPDRPNLCIGDMGNSNEMIDVFLTSGG